MDLWWYSVHECMSGCNRTILFIYSTSHNYIQNISLYMEDVIEFNCYRLQYL
jgi:hypothetical protein